MPDIPNIEYDLERYITEARRLRAEQLNREISYIQEDDMPQRRSRANPPTENDIIIRYDAVVSAYRILVPLNQTRFNNVDGYSTLQNARRDAIIIRDDFNSNLTYGTQRYSTWPRMSSNIYRMLEAGISIDEYIPTNRLIVEDSVPLTAPNEYSFRIEYANAAFNLHMPANQGRFSYHNIATATIMEAIRTGKEYVRTFNSVNGRSSYNLWPVPGSAEYTALMASALPNDGSNEFSFRITWDVARERFTIIPPVNQLDDPSGDNGVWQVQIVNQTLERAYSIAEDYVARSIRNTDNNRYNVFPAKGTEKYEELIALSAPPEFEVANSYSFVISYNPEYCAFTINCPSTQDSWDTAADETYSLHDVYIVALDRAKQLRQNSRARLFNVWPSKKSIQYRQFKALCRRHEVEATTPNTNSLRIDYSSRQNAYIVTYPEILHRRITTTHMFEDLRECYNAAFINIRTVNAEMPGQNFNVYPPRGSEEYNILVQFKPNAPVPEFNLEDNNINPTNISGLDKLKQIFKFIKLFPEGYDTEDKITEVIYYLAWKLHGINYTSEQVKAVRDKLLVFLNKFTGQEFVTTENIYQLVHKSNIVSAVMIENGAPVSVTIRYFQANCSMCNTCNVGFNNNLIHEVSSLRRDGNSNVCNTCLVNSPVYECTNCNDYHREEEGCPRYNSMPIEHVYSYSTDVRSVIPRMFHTIKDKPNKGNYLRYGVELEVLPREGVDHRLIRKLVGTAIKGHAIMKPDSSIGPTGIEIVTAPATLDYHRTKLWNKLFDVPVLEGKAAAKFIRSWGTDVCGLHIHITRAALDKMQLSKLLVFYHEPANAGFLSRIAGRSVGPNARYCKMEKKRLHKDTARQCGDHHEAIAISHRNHGKTAEVRIFRGNATKHGVIRALEFVDATIQWCANNAASGLTSIEFIKWFNQPGVRASYPELWRQMLELGYLKTKHKSKDSTGFNLVPTELRTA